MDSMAQALMDRKSGMEQKPGTGTPMPKPGFDQAAPAQPSMQLNMSNLADKLAAMRQNGGIFGTPEQKPNTPFGAMAGMAQQAGGLQTPPMPQGVPPMDDAARAALEKAQQMGGPIPEKPLTPENAPFIGAPVAGMTQKLGEFKHPGQVAASPMDISRIQQMLQQMFANRQSMRVSEPTAPAMQEEQKPVDGSY